MNGRPEDTREKRTVRSPNSETEVVFSDCEVDSICCARRGMWGSLTVAEVELQRSRHVAVMKIQYGSKAQQEMALCDNLTIPMQIYWMYDQSHVCKRKSLSLKACNELLTAWLLAVPA